MPMRRPMASVIDSTEIATSRETTVGEMAGKLVATLQAAGVAAIKLVNAETRLGDVKRNFSDTSKARNRLGWQSQINLDEGLRKTVAYFLNK